MRQQIPQFKPSFSEADSKAVSKVVESGWVSEGPKTKEFEEKVAKVMGYRFGISTNNGTVALLLGLLARGCSGVWELPDLTFVATAEAITLAGGKPKFVDIDAETFTAKDVDVPVYLNGRDAGTGVVGDEAQSLGSQVSKSFVATTSFAPNKIITTGQGGMVFTDDPETMEKVRRFKDHGRLDKADFHPQIGFDFKFSDLQAALGLSQLEKLPARIEHKRRICAQYQEELKNVRGLTVCEAEKDELLWNQDVLVKGRDRLATRLLEEGIQTRAFYSPLHTQPAYQTDESFPVTERISAMGLWLPSGPSLTEEAVTLVCEMIRKILK
jgi:perosamine synthetase